MGPNFNGEDSALGSLVWVSLLPWFSIPTDVSKWCETFGTIENKSIAIKQTQLLYLYSSIPLKFTIVYNIKSQHRLNSSVSELVTNNDLC